MHDALVHSLQLALQERIMNLNRMQDVTVVLIVVNQLTSRWLLGNTRSILGFSVRFDTHKFNGVFAFETVCKFCEQTSFVRDYSLFRRVRPT